MSVTGQVLPDGDSPGSDNYLVAQVRPIIKYSTFYRVKQYLYVRFYIK